MSNFSILRDDSPAFSEVLKLRDLHFDVIEIKELLRDFKNQIKVDYLNFIEGQDYHYCTRTINFLKWKNDDCAVQVVYEILELLEYEEDDFLKDASLLYLEKVLTIKDVAFLYEKWSTHKTLRNDFEYSAFLLLIQTGLRTPELKQRAVQMIWDQPADCWFKPLIAEAFTDDSEIQEEIKRRLHFIAPIIKYMKNEFEDNDYFDEWAMLGSAWAENQLEKVVVKKLNKNEEETNSDDFLKTVLSHTDERTYNLILKNFKASLSDLTKSNPDSKMELLEERFLSSLPQKCNDWIHALPIFDAQRKEYEGALSEYGEKPSQNVKVGRNDPCICGSGIKFKKCCLSF